MSKRAPPNIDTDNAPLLHAAHWRFGEFELEESRRELSRSGELLALEPKPLNLLMLMLRHPGELITKDDIMEALWTGRIVTDTVLTNCVSKLRAALGDGDSKLIHTVPGYGYRLEALPELVADSSAPATTALVFEPGMAVPLRPNWRLLRRIGRSGECWLAQHSKTVERRVFKFAYEPKELSAIKREVTLYRLLRQTLAENAPILDLLDWNFDEPPWFIETQYCELGSVQEYLEQLGGVTQLPLAERLALVIQIAEALAAVHSVGIIHKDLKPANVLVTTGLKGEIVIKLADFGSGRVLDERRLAELAVTKLGFTQFSDPTGSNTSGTPLYFAPEVLSGQPVTLKADVYALGVILYQLVVGDLRRLFAPGWEAGVDDELLRQDISAAAAGDPQLRLADAGQLAERLRGLAPRRQALAEQREQAQQAQATARELELVKARRKGLRWAAGALALGLVVSLGLFLRAQAAQREALNAAARAEAVSGYLLGDVLGQLTNPAEPVQSLTVLQLLDHAASRVDAHFKAQPATASQLQFALGDAYWQFGRSEPAIAQLLLALDKAEVNGQPATPASLKIAALLTHLLGHAGQLEPQLARFQTLLEQGRQQLGARNLEVLSLQARLAFAANLAGRYSDANRQFREVLHLTDSTPGAEALGLETRSALGILLMRLADYPEAETIFTQALSRLEAAGQAESRDAAKAHMRLGLMLTKLGRLDAAEQHLGEARRIIKRWEPASGYMTVVIALNQLRLLQARGDIAAAYTQEREVEALKAQSGEGNDDSEFADFLVYAHTRLLDQKYDEALALLKKAETMLARYRQKDHPDQAEVALEKASVYLAQTKFAMAEQALQAVPDAAWALLPIDHPLVAERQLLRAKLAMATGDSATAKAKLLNAKEIYSKRLGPNHQKTLESARLLSRLSTGS